MFKKGDIVKVVNTDHIYSNHSQFVKLHFKYAVRWVYKEFPNKEHKFKILGVYRHIMKNNYDRNDKCIVISDTITKQIYLIGELGIEPITK